MKNTILKSTLSIALFGLFLWSSCADKYEKDLIKMGSAHITDTYSMTVLECDVSEKLGPFREAAAERQFISVQVEYINISAEDQLYFATQFAIMDQDSVKYSPMLSGKIPEFGTSGTIKTGSQQKGWLSYDVPSTIEKYQLVFRSDLLGGEVNHFSLKSGS